MAHVPRDAEATKQRLLDAASSEFAERGFAGAPWWTPCAC